MHRGRSGLVPFEPGSAALGRANWLSARGQFWHAESLSRVGRNNVGREIHVPGQLWVVYYRPVEAGAVRFFLVP